MRLAELLKVYERRASLSSGQTSEILGAVAEDLRRITVAGGDAAEKCQPAESPPPPASLADLAEQWRKQAEVYERDAVVGHAALLRRLANELEAAWRVWFSAELTIGEAAAESGYSEDRLRELVREGQLPAARKGRGPITVQRSDLPRRPGRPPAQPVEAMAETILAGRRSRRRR